MIRPAVHSLLVLAGTALFLAATVGARWAGDPAVWAGALVGEALVAFSWFIAQAGRTARSPASIVTAARLVIAIALLGTLAVSEPPAWLALLVFAVAIAGEATDFADGAIARRTGPTAFGARFDAETDALFVLALSLLAVHWYRAPSWVVAAGLLRYVTSIPFLLLPEPAFSARFMRFAKAACAAAALLLVAIAMPIESGSAIARSIAGGVAVTLLAVSFGWEATTRLRALRDRRRADGGGAKAWRRERGLWRSVLTYYGVPFRQFLMRRLYRRFVRPGDLAFDVGSHVGNRIVALRALGARVVAIEPQPHCVRFLERHFGADTGTTIVAAACSNAVAAATLKISSRHPTVSTMSDQWAASIREHFPKSGVDWDESVTVSTVTLDALIAEHGVPSFVKIDVEGYEPRVLSGLSHAIDAISFEFLPASISAAIESLRRVDSLGTYRFNYSMVETMRFAAPEWLSADEMERILRRMPASGRSGDVYAVRPSSAEKTR